MNVLVIGNGGREAALAWRLARDARVFAVMGHVNPTIAAACVRTGGIATIDAYLDPGTVAQYAVEHRIDLAIVQNDDALAAGVVDALKDVDVAAVGPTQSGAEIEWNKVFARRLLHEVAPDWCPSFWVVENLAQLPEVFAGLRRDGIEVAVKPQGLTGGKGVKVMGPHLADHAAAQAYAAEILTTRIGSSDTVLIEQKMSGIEFTLQAMTDGRDVVPVPASYDYPYRLVGDTGPGTGGMGAFTIPGGPLPFLQLDEYRACLQLARVVVQSLNDRGRHFNGVLNVGFFLTADGLKVTEFNARIGDPECINLMMGLDPAVSASRMFQAIARDELSPGSVRFINDTTVVKYLVSPDYCFPPGVEHAFGVDIKAIVRAGAQVFFSAAEARDGRYVTVGSSRTVAIATTARTLGPAGARIERCIERYVSGDLQHRPDIAAPAYVDGLKQTAVGLRAQARANAAQRGAEGRRR